MPRICFAVRNREAVTYRLSVRVEVELMLKIWVDSLMGVSVRAFRFGALEAETSDQRDHPPTVGRFDPSDGQTEIGAMFSQKWTTCRSFGL